MVFFVGLGRREWFSIFSSTAFRVGFSFCWFFLLVNVMSYITFNLSVYTQYLRQHNKWLWALISPIVRTVNKSTNLLAGFDLF